jgi:transcriptional regulator
MLVHPWDAGTAAEGLALARAHGFGLLIASGRNRDVPIVVPTQFVIDGDGAASEIMLHLARPNPIWQAIEENPTVLLSVAGDWAYVPAAWKVIGDEDPAWGIPTTYYAAVQLVGTATVITDAAGKAEILRRQISAVDDDGGVNMVDPERHTQRLPGILGIRIAVTRVVAKFKYGGNVDAAHRWHVADALERRSNPGDTAALGHLIRRSNDLGEGRPS